MFLQIVEKFTVFWIRSVNQSQHVKVHLFLIWKKKEEKEQLQLYWLYVQHKAARDNLAPKWRTNAASICLWNLKPTQIV